MGPDAPWPERRRPEAQQAPPEISAGASRPPMIPYEDDARGGRRTCKALRAARSAARARQAMSRIGRRSRPRLRARRSRRRQDARAHAVPRAPLEWADVSVRADALGL